MTHLLKPFLVLLLLSQIFACTSVDSNNGDGATNESTAQETAAKPTKTITGVVWNIESGKDGYTATLSTSDATDYYAVISIPNVGGPDNYSELRLGETATLSGEPLKVADQNRLIVRTIDSQKPSELCWLADGPTNLYSAPNADSKNYGKFFQGETLTVLADPIENNNETWIKVYFRGTVKAGYEDKFADGRPMHEGIESMVGWIGGKARSIVRCK